MTPEQTARMSAELRKFANAAETGDLSAYVPIDRPVYNGGVSRNLLMKISDKPVTIDWLGSGFVFGFAGQCYA